MPYKRKVIPEKADLVTEPDGCWGSHSATVLCVEVLLNGRRRVKIASFVRDPGHERWEGDNLAKRVGRRLCKALAKVCRDEETDEGPYCCPYCSVKLQPLYRLPTPIRLYYRDNGITTGRVCSNPRCKGKPPKE